MITLPSGCTWPDRNRRLASAATPASQPRASHRRHHLLPIDCQAARRVRPWQLFTPMLGVRPSGRSWASASEIARRPPPSPRPHAPTNTAQPRSPAVPDSSRRVRVCRFTAFNRGSRPAQLSVTTRAGVNTRPTWADSSGRRSRGSWALSIAGTRARVIDVPSGDTERPMASRPVPGHLLGRCVPGRVAVGVDRAVLPTDQDDLGSGRGAPRRPSDLGVSLAGLGCLERPRRRPHLRTPAAGAR